MQVDEESKQEAPPSISAPPKRPRTKKKKNNDDEAKVPLIGEETLSKLAVFQLGSDFKPQKAEKTEDGHGTSSGAKTSDNSPTKKEQEKELSLTNKLLPIVEGPTEKDLIKSVGIR